MIVLRNKLFGVENADVIKKINILSEEELRNLIETSNDPAEIAAAQRRLNGTLPDNNTEEAKVLVLGLHNKN